MICKNISMKELNVQLFFFFFMIKHIVFTYFFRLSESNDVSKKPKDTRSSKKEKVPKTFFWL